MLSLKTSPIILDKTREIKVVSFHQWETYKNLLCGLPTQQLNKGIIEDAVNHATKVFHKTEKIFLIEPQQIPIKLNVKLPYGEPFKLPKITCILEMTYTELLNDQHINHISELNMNNLLEVDTLFKCFGVVWFQEEYSHPITSATLEKFKNMKWSI